jgi:hypothetical protein
MGLESFFYLFMKETNIMLVHETAALKIAVEEELKIPDPIYKTGASIIESGTPINNTERSGPSRP